MTRSIAFLRAINVGGHIVKMDFLRTLFESLGFSNVETFIASGNVLFETNSRSISALEARIEMELREALGYEVATFIRTEAELKAVAVYQAFSRSQLEAAIAFNVAFLKEPPDAAMQRKVMGWKTDIDDFAIHGRELYWLCKKRQSQSTFSNAVLERALGKPSTIRGLETVRKIVARFSMPD
ncbi:MAG TPA: DUF1697 domain-containing protein [Anaerolineales bacterium]|nr:DUF1697 domain-containing protein [Anaerolineales bacterium]